MGSREFTPLGMLGGDPRCSGVSLGPLGRRGRFIAFKIPLGHRWYTAGTPLGHCWDTAGTFMNRYHLFMNFLCFSYDTHIDTGSLLEI